MYKLEKENKLPSKVLKTYDIMTVCSYIYFDVLYLRFIIHL